MKLHTENIGGNLHSAATYINRQGWADYVIHMDSVRYNTIVVFKMPDELVWKIRGENKSPDYDPHHDDPRKSFEETMEIPPV